LAHFWFTEQRTLKQGAAARAGNSPAVALLGLGFWDTILASTVSINFDCCEVAGKWDASS
jgi:hypothetical protein